MDNLAHTLIGVTMANAGLKQRFGRGTTLALAVASNIPDIDVFGAFFHPGPNFAYRRMLTHSLIALPLLTAAFAAVYRLAFPTLSFRRSWGLWAAGALVHVFFDLVNSFGVVLLYPLSRRRFELSSVFIVDLAIWAILLAPLALSRFRRPWSDLRRLSRGSAVALTVYMAACLGLRWHATVALRQYEIYVGLVPTLSYVFPEPFGPLNFRGVVRQDDIYRVYRINAVTRRITKFDELRTQDHLPAARRILDTDMGRTMAWFAKAPVIRRVPSPDAGPELWEIFDLRFGSTILRAVDPPFRYGFAVDGDRVEFLGPL